MSGQPVLDVVNASDRPVALVTGGTSGIGRAIVEELAATHLVVAAGRNPAALSSVGALGSVVSRALDLTEPRAFAALADELPRLDVLVHNAAHAERFRVEDASVADWETALATNVIAPAELSRVFLPQLRASNGIVVFIGSGSSRNSTPDHTVYAATKHALQAVADGLRRETGPDGIRVSTVAPGPTLTPGATRDDRYGTVDRDRVRSDPATIARAVRFVIDAPGDSQVAEMWVRPRVE